MVTTIKGNYYNEKIKGTEVDEIIFGYGGIDDLYGYGGNDVIYGGNAGDYIYGGEGDDILWGGIDKVKFPDYYISPDYQSDTIWGGRGNDIIYGGIGDDSRLDGQSGNNVVYGGDGDDNIYGGRDELYGDAGDDTFNIFLYGTGKVDGGEGEDRVILGGNRSEYTITKGAATITNSKGTNTFKNVEHFIFDDGEWDGVADADPDHIDCPHDTGNFLVTGNWNYVEKPNKMCELTDSFKITHSKGTAALSITNSGIATHNDKTLNVSNGVIFAGPDQIRLFAGGISNFSFTNGVAAVTDTKNNKADLQLGGYDLTFLNLSVLKDSVRADVAMRLPSKLTGDDNKIDISGAVTKGFTVTVDETGAYIGLAKTFSYALPDMQYNYFQVVIAKATHQSISYTSLTDTFKIQGKYEFESFFKGTSVDKLELDLSGNNFIQLSDGDVDMVGSLKYSKNIEWKVPGFGLSHLQLDVNTIAHTFGGSVGVRLPFFIKPYELSASVQFITEPELAINALGIKLDGLNVAVGTTGLFMQSVNFKVADWSELDKKPTSYSGGAQFTAGPEIYEKKIGSFDLQVTGDKNQLIGDGKMVLIDSRIFTGSVKVTANWEKTATLKIDGTYDILDGLAKTTASFNANKNFDFSFDSLAEVYIPKFIFGIGGTKISSTNLRVSYTNDGDSSNDFVAHWQEKQFIGYYKTVTYIVGAKYTFDNGFSIIGLETLPQITASSASMAKAVAKTTVEAGNLPDWIMLMANWETSTTGNVAVRVTDPNSNTWDEAQFFANRIEIVTDLSNEFNKTVIVTRPFAGDWHIELVNETPLGKVKYSAAVENTKPVLTLTSPDAVLDAPNQVNIKYNAIDPDSVGKISFYYDTDDKDFDGVLIKANIIENDGDGNFVWDLSGVATGSYYVYGVLSDGINPEVMSYASGRIDVNTGGDGATEGTNGYNHLIGTDDNDLLHGLGGYDIIEGRAGNDTLKGGAGGDEIIDTLGNDSLIGNDGTDKLITLSGLNNSNGGDDNDFIIGGIETDTLNGGNGNDVIRGDASDFIGGSDHITGGKGDDVLMGGKGADIFSFNSNDGKDIIGQFKTENVVLSDTEGYSVQATAADFISNVDQIELLNFNTVNADNIFDFISDISGSAVFDAEGTEFTFFGVLENQLSANDFLFT